MLRYDGLIEMLEKALTWLAFSPSKGEIPWLNSAKYGSMKCH
jgi:hypothetical protein